MSPTLISTKVTLAMHYLRQHRYPATKAVLLQLNQLDAHALAVLETWGYYYHSLGDPAKALDYYRLAAHAHRHAGSAHNNYAIVLCEQRQYHAAIQQFKQAIAESSYIHTGLAVQNLRICERRQHLSHLKY